MAKSEGAIIVTLICSIIISIPTCHSTSQSPKAIQNWIQNLNHEHEKITQLHFFCHHLHGTTATTIAKAAMTDNSPMFFGLLDTRDDPLTVGPEESSKNLGYAQGISASASLEEISSFDPFTFVFTNNKYKGSTLAVMGSCPIFNKSCEAAVVGGTGVFRLARGFVTTKSFYLNFTTGKASLEIYVVALHY